MPKLLHEGDLGNCTTWNNNKTLKSLDCNSISKELSKFRPQGTLVMNYNSFKAIFKAQTMLQSHAMHR